MLMWLINEIKGEETRRPIDTLGRQLLLVNLAAIHSTSLVSRFRAQITKLGL
jgi:hypothetical protein